MIIEPPRSELSTADLTCLTELSPIHGGVLIRLDRERALVHLLVVPNVLKESRKHIPRRRKKLLLQRNPQRRALPKS